MSKKIVDEKIGVKKSDGNHTIRINNNNYSLLNKIPSMYKQDVINNALEEYFKLHKDKIEELLEILEDLKSF